MPDSTNQTELKVTSAADWRKPAEGFTVKLPSEKVVKIRRTLDMFDMLKDGAIPNVLKGIVSEAILAGDTEVLNKEVLNPETLTGMIDFVNETVTRMLIEPRIATIPSMQEENARRTAAGEPTLGEAEYKSWSDDWWPSTDGYIPLRAIELEDRMFLFQVAQGGTTDIAKFREEQAGDVGSLSNGRTVPKPTKRTGGATKRK